ncbi:LOW QUALITY PROTEIN: H(+)/Cl(-) exchange transporter 6-like [Liolophura sinensis]|uniref:LOW QUALITY PROTEIN: H(+)/Cl(-) exchange transporter 6-like n=1 Tax=Liolophura sinensis TaxID=3198878 RepID=UPI0031589B37
MACLCCGRRNNSSSEPLEISVEQRPLLTVLDENEASGSHRDLPQKDYESLDYDADGSERPENTDANKYYIKLEVLKWVVTFLIGMFTGLVAMFIDTFVKLLSKWKFSTVEESINVQSKEGGLVLSLLWLLLFNVGFVFVAGCLTILEPVAAGSGIPEIKCYLNGVKVPRVMRLKTLVSKAIGVLFSVAGGLFVGKEGPMIHSGAIIGAGLPQFQSLAWRKLSSRAAYFRTDRDKRDFVSGGAAAGVAAAFGAPIGGVLFSLEEGSSFWNQKLTWRTFFCSMAATFVLNFFLSGADGGQWGYFYMPGLINFGVFSCQSGSGPACKLWDALDLLIFIAMGVVGGLLGALFNCLNTALTKHRMRHVQKKHFVFRILESLLVAMVTTTVSFTAAMTLGECRKIASRGASLNGTASPVSGTVRTYFCDEGYYNDMATLFFNPEEVGIKQLFHQEGTFSMPSLGIFFLCFFLLACWTYGAAVPSGLFVPCLLCGAAYGRFVATILVNVFGYHDVYSGTFALVGAAAFLGGVVRMTISLTVILIESTNEISYGLPIMIVLMVAKWCGDLFNEGLYDIHIKLRAVPFLEWDAPPGMERLKARDIMATNLSFIFPKTRVISLVRILRTTAHNGFPVIILKKRRRVISRTRSVSSQRGQESALEKSIGSLSSLDRSFSRESEDGEIVNGIIPTEGGRKFVGFILRSQLVTLLKSGVWYHDTVQASEQPIASQETMTRDYPRFADVHDLEQDQLHPRTVLDVTPYMNHSPYTVNPDTSVPRVFHLFRSMGLRHLPVVNSDGEIIGILTRHNLTHDYLEKKHKEHNNH